MGSGCRGVAGLAHRHRDSRQHRRLLGPEAAGASGDALSLAYQVAFAMADPEQHQGGRFVATRVDRLAGHDVRFTLAIESAALRSLAADTVLQPVVTANHGRVADLACSKLAGGAWQLRFRLAQDKAAPTELRAFVRQGSKVLTETWSYLCS